MATFEDFEKRVAGNVETAGVIVARESGPVVRMWFMPGCDGNLAGVPTVEAVQQWGVRRGYRVDYDEAADVFTFRRLNLTELIGSLYLVSRHLCCSRARIYLYPPNRASEGFVQLALGQAKVQAVDQWYIDQLDGGVRLPVVYCPWCGVRLAVPAETEGEP